MGSANPWLRNPSLTCCCERGLTKGGRGEHPETRPPSCTSLYSFLGVWATSPRGGRGMKMGWARRRPEEPPKLSEVREAFGRPQRGASMDTVRLAHPSLPLSISLFSESVGWGNSLPPPGGGVDPPGGEVVDPRGKSPAQSTGNHFEGLQKMHKNSSSSSPPLQSPPQSPSQRRSQPPPALAQPSPINPQPSPSLRRSPRWRQRWCSGSCPSRGSQSQKGGQGPGIQPPEAPANTSKCALARDKVARVPFWKEGPLLPLHDRNVPSQYAQLRALAHEPAHW